MGDKLVSEVIVETKDEADAVISGLIGITKRYEYATVSDLYELVGMYATYTHAKYGWTDLSSACVTRVSDGYKLLLPDPIML